MFCLHFWSHTNVEIDFKNYDKRDNFNFEIVNFLFLGGDVPRSPSYGECISQLIRFAMLCSNVDDLNNRNKLLTSKLLNQCYRCHTLHKAISKFYYIHTELECSKALLQQGILELEFYGYLVYKFKRIVGKPILAIDLKS